MIDRGEARAALVIPRGPPEGSADRPSRARAGDHQRRQLEHRDDGDGIRAAACCRRPRPSIRRRRRRRPRGTARHGRVARLVQPAASQRALSHPGPHRLHRHDLGGHLDVPLRRSRERARHDGAGAHGASRHRLVHHRQDAAVFRHLARARRCSSCSRRWCCSACP